MPIHTALEPTPQGDIDEVGFFLGFFDPVVAHSPFLQHGPINIDTLREANEVEDLHNMGALNEPIVHSFPHISIQYNNPSFVLPVAPFQIHCLLWTLAV